VRKRRGGGNYLGEKKKKKANASRGRMKDDTRRRMSVCREERGL